MTICVDIYIEEPKCVGCGKHIAQDQSYVVLHTQDNKKHQDSTDVYHTECWNNCREEYNNA